MLLKNEKQSDTFFKLRAHHGMCLHYYQGKGYSSKFTENMTAVLSYLQTNNPMVTIIDQADHVCAKCPNLLFGKCSSIDKVSHYDRKTLDAAGIEAGTKMTWQEYHTLVEEKILRTGMREKICGDCRWNELCQ